MRLSDCHNTDDFRRLAQKRLPSPVFHYIDGAADDEITKDRNTAAFDDCDLVPNVLAGVETINMKTTVMGREIAMPLFLSPTALQRVFHWQGERAVGAAAEKFDTWFGISSLATVSIEEIGRTISSPKLFQLYVHKDKGLNAAMVDACKAAKFDAIALTVDTIVSGKRERCMRTGFTSPPKITPMSALSYALHPAWSLNYFGREKFDLPKRFTSLDRVHRHFDCARVRHARRGAALVSHRARGIADSFQFPHTILHGDTLFSHPPASNRTTRSTHCDGCVQS